MSTSNINTEQVLAYLSKAFNAASQQATRVKAVGRDNVKGTKLYELQVDFCYLQNEIARGPSYIVPKRITEANALVAKINEMTETATITNALEKTEQKG